MRVLLITQKWPVCKCKYGRNTFSLCVVLKFLSDYKFTRLQSNLENVKSLLSHLQNIIIHAISRISRNQLLPLVTFQYLFTCDEDNLDRESITLGTSAIGVGWPELPPLLLLTPETADMTVPEPPTTCHHPYIFFTCSWNFKCILSVIICVYTWTSLIY